MSLTECSECGHKVSTQAAACPECGAPTQQVSKEAPPAAKKKSGRRLVALLGVLVLLLAVWFVAVPSPLKGLLRKAAPWIVPGPVTRHDKTYSIHEDQYVFMQLDMESGGGVEVRVRVASGPEVDVYMMHSRAFAQWKKAVKEGGGKFRFIPEFSQGKTRRVTREGTLPRGTYVLVVDNTDYGDASPPMNMVDDVAVVHVVIATD